MQPPQKGDVGVVEHQTRGYSGRGATGAGEASLSRYRAWLSEQVASYERADEAASGLHGKRIGAAVTASGSSVAVGGQRGAA